MSLTTLARSSLKQFTIILADVRAEHPEVSGEQLEELMWEKILAGRAVSGGTKISSDALRKLKIQLPYLPESINYVGCCALKTCGGLFVPCGAKLSEGSPYCLVCSKHEAKHGTLADRGDPGNYTDPSDRHEITYGTWLAKNEKTIEDVHQELREKGFTIPIPEDYLTVNVKRETKKRAGAPKKVKKTKIHDDGTESPSGSSLDGKDVVFSSESSGEEESENTKKIREKVKARKEKATPEEKEKAKAEKEALKEAKKAEKAEKAEKKSSEKVEKPEKKSAEKADKPAKSEKKSAEKSSEKKAEKPKSEKKPKTEPEKKKTEELEPEPETEIIDGEECIIRGNQAFDLEGTIKAVKNKSGEWDTI
jgi:hypothetical protein